jgi:hypothetical protein
MADLNAQQVAAVNEQFRHHIAETIKQLDLRKWAMEKALADKLGQDPIDLATRIYDFVVKPALEPFNPGLAMQHKRGHGD